VIRFVPSLVLLQAALAGEGDELVGRWWGTAGFPEDRIEEGYEIRRDAKQELEVLLYRPVVNFYGLRLPGTLVQQGDAWVLKSFGVTFRVKDGRLVGTEEPFRGPFALERTERFPSEPPMPELPAGPAPRWTRKLGPAIYATAAVLDGTVYVGTTGGMVHAMSLADGSLRWTFTAGRPLFGEPLATEDALFFVCDDGLLRRLERDTGREVWRYDLGDATAPRSLPHPVVENGGSFDWCTTASKPLLLDDVLYVGSGDGSLHAVDAESGRRVWRAPTRGAVRTDAASDGSSLFVGTLAGLVQAFDLASGSPRWQRDTQAMVTSSPVLIGGKLVAGNRSGLFVAFDPANGDRKWARGFWGSSVESTPVAGDDGRLYVGSSDLRRACCFDGADGRVLWRTDVHGWAWARPAVTPSRLFVCAIGVSPYEIRHSGSLNALDRESGKILWRWAMPEWPGSFLSGFAASPVVAGDAVVVGGLDGSMYCFPAE